MQLHNIRPLVEEVLRDANGPITIKEIHTRVCAARPETSSRQIYRSLSALESAQRVGGGLWQIAPPDPTMTCVLPQTAPPSVLGLVLLQWMSEFPAGASLRWSRSSAGYAFTLAPNRTMVGAVVVS